MEEKNLLWEALTPEAHDESAEFWDGRAKEAAGEHRPGDSEAIRENIDAYVAKYEAQANEHRAAAKRKRSTEGVV